MNVLIVDDHLLFRDGLVGLMRNRPEYTVIGEAGTVREAVEKAHSLRPDLILMDFTLPDGTGLDATREILADLPDCQIVFLTISDDNEALVEAVRCGAKGYVLKNVSVTALFANLNALRQGEMAISRSLSTRLILEMAKPKTAEPRNGSALSQLSSREVDILVELTAGFTNDEIAQHLFISANTVKHHIQSIFSKLDVQNRHAAAQYARDHGLKSRLVN